MPYALKPREGSHEPLKHSIRSNEVEKKSKCVVPCVRVFRGVNPKTWGSIGCGQAPAGAARDSKKRWPRLHLEVRYSFRTSNSCLLSSVGRALDFWAGSSDGSSGGLKIRRSVVQSHSGPPNQGVPSSNLGGDTICTISVVVTPCPSKALSWVRAPHGTPTRRIYYFGEYCGNVRIRMILAANYNGLIIIFLTKCARCTPITSGTRRAQTGRSELELILE